MQLTEAGVPAWDALAAKIGGHVPTAMDMVSKKPRPPSTTFDAIEAEVGRSVRADLGRHGSGIGDDDRPPVDDEGRDGRG